MTKMCSTVTFDRWLSSALVSSFCLFVFSHRLSLLLSLRIVPLLLVQTASQQHGHKKHSKMPVPTEGRLWGHVRCAVAVGVWIVCVGRTWEAHRACHLEHSRMSIKIIQGIKLNCLIRNVAISLKMGRSYWLNEHVS